MNEKLRHQQKQESDLEHAQQQGQVSNAQEFSSVEEMLRSDAAQTSVPDTIAAKLNHSIGKEPPQKNTSWWKRLFGN